MACIIAVLFLTIAESKHLFLANGSLSDVASVCSHDTMCNSTPTTIFNESDFKQCCQKCSCASDCHTFGNCCQDIYTNNISEPVYPCVDISLLFNEERGLHFPPYFDIWLHVIDSCPDRSREVAYPACKKPVELADFAMVSDDAGEKVFKNRHCAMCHGIREYIVWDIYTSCREIAINTFETFDEMDRLLLNECPLLSLPPHGRFKESTRCFSDSRRISKCYSSDVSNELKEACETKRPLHNTAFFVNIAKMGQHLKVYANIYCYLCNNPEQSLHKDMCPPTQRPQGESFGQINFLALINPYVAEAVSVAFRCRSIDMWDPFDNVCRRLFCQNGYIPLEGSCKEGLVNTIGNAMSVMFTVNTNNRSEVIVSLKDFLAKKLYRLGRLNFYCGKCDPIIHRSDSLSELLFELPIRTTLKCSTQQVLQYIERLTREDEIQLQYKNAESTVNTSLKVTFESIGRRQQISALKTDKSCLIRFLIDKTTLQNCPRIELSVEETSGLNGRKGFSKKNLERMLIRNELTNKTSVCVKNYFQLRRLAENGQTNLHSYRKWLQIVSLGILLSANFLKD